MPVSCSVNLWTTNVISYLLVCQWLWTLKAWTSEGCDWSLSLGPGIPLCLCFCTELKMSLLAVHFPFSLCCPPFCPLLFCSPLLINISLIIASSFILQTPPHIPSSWYASYFTNPRSSLSTDMASFKVFYGQESLFLPLKCSHLWNRIKQLFNTAITPEHYVWLSIIVKMQLIGAKQHFCASGYSIFFLQGKSKRDKRANPPTKKNPKNKKTHPTKQKITIVLNVLDEILGLLNLVTKLPLILFLFS